MPTNERRGTGKAVRRLKMMVGERRQGRGNDAAESCLADIAFAGSVAPSESHGYSTSRATAMPLRTPLDSRRRAM